MSDQSESRKRVLLFLEDLFFLSKIEQTCRGLQLDIEITSNVGKLNGFLSEGKRDLLIVDLNLNRETIPETIAGIRQEHPHLAIIGFAGFRQQDLLERCKLAGATEVHVKAEFMEKLEEIIRRAAEV